MGQWRGCTYGFAVDKRQSIFIQQYICVEYQKLEDLVKVDKCKLFLAQPSTCNVPYVHMTDVQQL